MALISTRAIIDRWKRSIGPTRGNVYYVAPGATQIYVAGRALTPSNGYDGLTPFQPLASIEELIDRFVSGRGDIGVLMLEGEYALEANIITTKKDITIMAAPGLNPRATYIVGVAGSDACWFKGGNTRLSGFEIDGGDAAFASCVISGRYSILEDMVFTAGGATPEQGLVLKPLAAHASGDRNDASFCHVKGGQIDYCTTGLAFGVDNGSDFAGPTNNLIEGVIFGKNVTRDIGQGAGAATDAIQGTVIRGCTFRGPLPAGATGKFIKLDAVDNGADDINFVEGNIFADDAVASTGDVQFTNTTTRFKFVGNIDKAGFITGV